MKLTVEFRGCDAGRSPASELIAATLAEYEASAGRQLRGGPSATPQDFSPPGGAYLVGFLNGSPECGGGLKALGDGAAEVKRMYVAPRFRRHGLGRALLQALENRASDLGYEVVRLDCQSRSASWPLYVTAGYREIPDYNQNPYADVWGEKRL